MSEPAQRPYCLAMVLCDAVHRDPTTGKFSILGTFSTFTAFQIPRKAKFCIYVALTDALGEFPLGIRIVDSSDLLGEHEGSGPIADIKGDVKIEGPLVIMETALNIQVTFPEPGVYHCELYCGPDVLMSRRITVLDIPQERASTDE